MNLEWNYSLNTTDWHLYTYATQDYTRVVLFEKISFLIEYTKLQNQMEPKPKPNTIKLKYLKSLWYNKSDASPFAFNSRKSR